MIEVSHVSKNFGNFAAVSDISFSIPAGQIVGLLGPNGAGKTTTMRMITGFWQASCGTIKIAGQDINKDPVKSKRKIGYMPESAPLYSDMIVEDYLSYICNVHGLNFQKKVPELCKLCGLEEVMHKNISELSRGYRQRVGLAHALANDPEILILDEPTSGLDPNQITQVRNLIKEIGKTRTVIISTHILGEVESLCDRVIIINGGKIVADSPTHELQKSFGGITMVNLCLEGCNFTAAKKLFGQLDGVMQVIKRDEAENIPGKKLLSVQIQINGSKEIRDQIFKTCVKNKLTVYEMTAARNSLEDVFHKLTKENQGA